MCRKFSIHLGQGISVDFDGNLGIEDLHELFGGGQFSSKGVFEGECVGQVGEVLIVILAWDEGDLSAFLCDGVRELVVVSVSNEGGSTGSGT